MSCGRQNALVIQTVTFMKSIINPLIIPCFWNSSTVAYVVTQMNSTIVHSPIQSLCLSYEHLLPFKHCTRTFLVSWAHCSGCTSHPLPCLFDNALRLTCWRQEVFLLIQWIRPVKKRGGKRQKRESEFKMCNVFYKFQPNYKGVVIFTVKSSYFKTVQMIENITKDFPTQILQ